MRSAWKGSVVEASPHMVTWQRPLTSRVSRRRTLSSGKIRALSVFSMTSISYCRCSRPMAQYSVVLNLQPPFFVLTKWKSCQKKTQDHGRRWPGIFFLMTAAAEQNGQWGVWPLTMRHEHVLGFIGRSYSPAQTQERKREGRKHRFHIICKKESRTTESSRQIIFTW